MKLNLLIYFLHRGIGNKKVYKNFQVWVPHDNFEQQAKRKGGRGAYSAPLPHGLRG